MAVAFLEFEGTVYGIPVGEARVIRANLRDAHSELELLIEVLGNEIAGDARKVPLDGVAAQAVWDAMKPMNPLHGVPEHSFYALYEALQAKFG